jgi:glycosyltransferase involved in cell wall biosynthesis
MYGGETLVPELLGQTLLEGMACGLPAICTSVASMPEIVVDGVTGFVVPPNDPRALSEKIAWLRDHPERARAMGEAARKRVLDKFTWPQVVQRCLDIYQGLCLTDQEQNTGKTKRLDPSVTGPIYSRPPAP